MSRSVIKNIQRFGCCLAVILVVGAQQFASAEPSMMCYFANCFDAGQTRQGVAWTGDDSALAATGSIGKFKRIAITPIDFEKGVSANNLSSSTDRFTLNVPQASTNPVEESNVKFTFTASTVRSNNTSTAGTGSFTVLGAVTVPEPASMMLLGAGLVGLAMKARKRRQ